jgi:3-methyladenine DNA glycosylase AlkD
MSWVEEAQMNASEYTEAVEELLHAHGDSNVAGPMAQYMIALDVLEKSKKRLTPDHLPFVVELITTKSWWDTVDYLASDYQLLFSLVERCADSKEFFIQKAIGWALREYAKTNPGAVREFVEATPLASLSRREALKHLS